MPTPNHVAHLIERFGFVFRRPAGYRPLHDADSVVFNPTQAGLDPKIGHFS
jgi:hypothetical protein